MKYIYVGKLQGTHGLLGELKLKSCFKYSDKIFVKDFIFYVGNDKKKVLLSKVRRNNDKYLISFKDYCDIDAVQVFKNNKLYINRDDLKLSDCEYVFEDYMDLDCYYDDKMFGRVVDIVNCGFDNYVFLIKGFKEVLIPVNDNFIDRVIKDDKIIFKNVGELIDAN